MTNTEARHSGPRSGKHQLKAQSQKLKANLNSLNTHTLVHVLELDVAIVQPRKNGLWVKPWDVIRSLNDVGALNLLVATFILPPHILPFGD